MTHPIVSDELVEKAARAISPKAFEGPAGYASTTAGFSRRVALKSARAALEAVAGDIAKQVGEEIAQAIDARKPHIPVSTDPQRRTCIIERCTLNAAARIAREIGAGNGE